MLGKLANGVEAGAAKGRGVGLDGHAAELDQVLDVAALDQWRRTALADDGQGTFQSFTIYNLIYESKTAYVTLFLRDIILEFFVKCQIQISWKRIY